jgi:hypothetical protein
MHLITPRFYILGVGVFCAATALLACSAPSPDGLYGPGLTAAAGVGGGAGQAGGRGGVEGTDAGEAGAGGSGGEAAEAGVGGSETWDAALPDAEVMVDAGSDAALPPCGGAFLEGVCWYLGVVGEDESCDEVCEPRGGFDPDAIAFIGTADQGGSSEDCNAVMDALQADGAGMIASVELDAGIGCHLFEAERQWVMDTDFDPEDSFQGAGLACGCNE